MRLKLGVPIAVAVALLALAIPATAHKRHHRPKVEFVSGDASNRFGELAGPNRLSVWAFQKAGGPVHGYATGSGDLLPPPASGADFAVEGHVTCLRVERQLDGSGFAASLKYRYEKSSGAAAPPQGGGVEVFIEDNGDPVNGQPVDANATGPPLTPQLFEASDPRTCDDPNLAGQPFNPVDSGDYVVGAGRKGRASAR